MSEDLKPCPNCDSTDIKLYSVYRDEFCYECEDCGKWSSAVKDKDKAKEL